MNPLFITGYEDILEGILTPIAISLVVVIVRTALFGYSNVLTLAVNVSICCFAGICTHWILTALDWQPMLRAAIISLVAMFSREITMCLFSDKTLKAINARLHYEIIHFGRRHDK